MQKSRVEAVGICFLHAYANAEHERLAGSVLRDALPDVAVSLSSEVAPEIRECDRSVTALANAYAPPLARRYLVRIRTRLDEECGVFGALLIMQ